MTPRSRRYLAKNKSHLLHNSALCYVQNWLIGYMIKERKKKRK